MTVPETPEPGRTAGFELIAALATPAGEGALGVVRLSGAGLAECLARVLPGRAADLAARPRTMLLGRLWSPAEGRVVDRVLAVRFPGPGSFTGEDSAEIHCHGGAAAPRLVLEAVLAAGARPARPGEFTQRAFLNGRLSLDQAEAVAELVAARSGAEAALAARHLDGALARRIGPLADALKGMAADLAAQLDFLEDEWGEADRIALGGRLGELIREVRALIGLGLEGRVYREGLRVVLAGPPNAGKSSLFNALVGRERALVDPRPGTTRDYLEASVGWSGVRVDLVDTAGLGGPAIDEVEGRGRDLSRRELAGADLALWLSDLSDPSAGPPPPELGELLGGRLLVVGSKADLVAAAPSGPGDSGPGGSGASRLAVSSLTGEGLGVLKEAVLAAAGASGGPGPEVVPNLRQHRALEECLAGLESALEALDSGLALDAAAWELGAALTALGRVTGAVWTEDLLEEVFSRFCLGK